MNTIRTARIASLVIFAALTGAAHAQTSGLTRAEVKQETLSAIRTGDIAAPGDSGKTLRELFPSRYPAEPAVAQLTRAEVKADLKEAIRTGDIESSGDLVEPLNQLEPGRYPLQAGKSRL